jgi:hypothetical protein
VVKPQGGQKADYAARDALARLGQALLFARLGIREDVEAARRSLQNPLVEQTPEVFARNAFRCQVARAQDAVPSGEFKNPLPGRVVHVT